MCHMVIGFSKINRFSTAHIHLFSGSIWFSYQAEERRIKGGSGGCFFVWISMKSVRVGVWKGIFSVIFWEVLCSDEFQVRITLEMMESCISCQSVYTVRRLQLGREDGCVCSLRAGGVNPLICRYWNDRHLKASGHAGGWPHTDVTAKLKQHTTDFCTMFGALVWQRIKKTMFWRRIASPCDAEWANASNPCQ